MLSPRVWRGEVRVNPKLWVSFLLHIKVSPVVAIKSFLWIKSIKADMTLLLREPHTVNTAWCCSIVGRWSLALQDSALKMNYSTGCQAERSYSIVELSITVRGALVKTTEKELLLARRVVSYVSELKCVDVYRHRILGFRCSLFTICFV